MVKLTCTPHVALGIIAICNFYADNDCHKVLCDDTARRMIKTIAEGLVLGDDTTCSIKLDEVDCEDLYLLLEYFERTIPDSRVYLDDVLQQLFAAMNY